MMENTLTDSKQKSITQRIEWVDIYKFIGIIFVVVGHTTGLFNIWIYQFHMAAFFFISGYTTKSEKRTFPEVVYQRVFALLLPLIASFFLLLLFNIILNSSGYYTTLTGLSWMEPQEVIQRFFQTGDNFTQWMGAGWFIAALFGVGLVEKILTMITTDRHPFAYAVLSAALFILGNLLANHESNTRWSFFNLTYILIGQVFFVTGVLVRRYDIFSKINTKRYMPWLLLIGTTGLMYAFNQWGFGVVDYPSNYFGEPAKHVLTGYNGILFCYALSILIAQLPIAVKRWFIVGGKNTMGIVIFHFFFMKVGAVFLYLLRLIPKEMTVGVMPRGDDWLWVYNTLFSIIASVLFWMILNKIPIISFFFGNNRKSIGMFYDAAKRFIVNHSINVPFTKVRNALVKACGVVFSKIKRLCGRIWKAMKSHPAVTIFVLVTIFAISTPLSMPLVMCNDELISRLYSMQGFSQFASSVMETNINNGRAISAPFLVFSMYLGFIGVELDIYRIFSTLILLLDVLMFCIFIRKLLQNNWFSIFLGIFILLFLPFTFEHTAPNAFTTLFGVPLFLLFLSLYLYVCAFKEKSALKKWSSQILFFASMLFYESFVTYVPLYMILAIFYAKEDCKSRGNMIREALIPVVTGIFYLSVYIAGRMIFPSEYAGNQMSFEALDKSAAVIVQLFEASMPGYYLFNGKYQYIINSLSENMKWWETLTVGTVMLIVTTIPLLFLIFQKRDDGAGKSRWRNLWIVLTGFLCVILPSIPIALTEAYQNSVNDSNMIALPATYFSFFAAAFSVSYCIWLLLRFLRGRNASIVAACLISFFAFSVQDMNSQILTEQRRHYQALELIESVFQTETIHKLDHTQIDGHEIFKSRHALSVHDEYWTQYAATRGLTIEINNQKGASPLRINAYDDRYIVINDERSYVIFSRENLEGKEILLPIEDQTYRAVILQNGVKDGDMYVWAMSFEGEYSATNEDWDEVISRFMRYRNDIGSGLESALKNYGYYSDGWLEKESQFVVRTKEQGVIILKYYLPVAIDDAELEIYVGNELMKRVIVTEGASSVSVDVPSNEMVELTLKCNFERKASDTDPRMISILLSDLLVS